MDSWAVVLVVVTAALAVTAIIVAANAARRVSTARKAIRRQLPTLTRRIGGDGPLVAFVANGGKSDAIALRRAARAACAERYLPDPLWFETTEKDAGTGVARDAIAAGATVVVAIGGDGTVRAVAEAVCSTGVAMGIVPLGTGNLLARNIDLPLTDIDACLDIAVDGASRSIDVGRLRVQRWTAAERAPLDFVFCVISGIGFDAAMVADTDPGLKRRVGWLAYFISGIQHLHGRRMRVRATLDQRPTVNTRLRSLLIGNCGRLPGGLMLLPDAVVDDGWLDIAGIDTRVGVAGWVQLLGEVLLQGVGVRSELRAKIGRIDHTRAKRVHLEVADEQLQVDGEVIGKVRELDVWVDPGALIVRVPAPVTAR